MYEGSDTTDDESEGIKQSTAPKNGATEPIILSSDSESEESHVVSTKDVTKDATKHANAIAGQNAASTKRSASISGLEDYSQGASKQKLLVPGSASDRSGNDTQKSLPFPHGAVRHSQVVDRHSPMSISKDDLFLRHRSVRRALLLCFLVEFDFLHTLFEELVKVDIVTESNNVPGHIQHKNWTIQARLSQPFQCIHSKVFLIACDDFLRVVISTANLISVDYDNLDNVFYIHDFPMHKSEPASCQFQIELIKLLADHHVESDFKGLLNKTDFSSAQVSLIVSKPGTYYGELESHEYGQLALARHIADETKLDLSDDFVAEHCTSSIGNLNVPWIQSFRQSLSGRISESAVTKDNTKIIYPTFKDVEHSTKYGDEQRALADNIVCNGKFSDSAWPGDLFWGYHSCRYGTLFHSKTNLVHDGKSPKFLVFGSHNFSQAAWGSVVVQGPRARYKGLKTVIANYEVSVFIPGHLLNDHTLLPPGVDWKRSVTYQVDNGERYTADDRPWTVRFFT